MSACGNWHTSGRLTGGGARDAAKAIRGATVSAASACEGQEGQQREWHGHHGALLMWDVIIIAPRECGQSVSAHGHASLPALMKDPMILMVSV